MESELSKIKEINKNNIEQIKVIEQIIKLLSNNELVLNNNINSLCEYINMLNINYNENISFINKILNYK
jgi:hypothetical protein